MDFAQSVHVGRVQMLKGADDARVIPTNEPIVQQVESEWVTIWKNILSLFLRAGVNHFEGAP